MSVTVRATYRLTQWNANQLRARIPAILTAYGKVIDQQFKEEIKTVQFTWPTRWPDGTPRRTYRKNGTIETSPRDIVDLGNFLRSQKRNRLSATELRFVWDAPYASRILTGYVTRRNNVVPGRDWIAPALQAKPLDKFFAQQWKIQSRRGA